MIKILSIPDSEMPLPKKLLHICKKSLTSSSSYSPQIDFLLLQKQTDQLHQIQSKTCQQIVQFVDEHLQKFIEISKKLKEIQADVGESQIIVKMIMPEIQAMWENGYRDGSAMREKVEKVEKMMMVRKLGQICVQQALWLRQFVKDFQSFMNINIQKLTYRNRYNIVRLLTKKQYIKCIFEHPLLYSLSHPLPSLSSHSKISKNQLTNLLANIGQELQFYLSEQLNRVAGSEELRAWGQGKEKGKGKGDDGDEDEEEMGLLQELRIWYGFMGKEDSYYEIVQQAIVGRKFQQLQLSLLQHKQSFFTGTKQSLLNTFFSSLFTVLSSFPKSHPVSRLLTLTHTFLNKKQLSFLYSHITPAFPLSYSSYQSCLPLLLPSHPELHSILSIRHGWNLKFWADLRIKSIMDRSGRDGEKGLAKWIEIVFKKGYMIYGVRGYMVKLIMMMVNRYCERLSDKGREIEEKGEKGDTDGGEIVKIVNQAVGQIGTVGDIVRVKLMQAYEKQLANQKTKQIAQTQINKTVNNLAQSLESALNSFLLSSTKTLISSCISSFEPYKQFVLSLLTPKKAHSSSPSPSPSSTPNTQQTLLKPLFSFFKNNPTLSSQSRIFMQKFMLLQLEQAYDLYAKNVYNFCISQVSTQQMRTVMEVVGRERAGIFVWTGDAYRKDSKADKGKDKDKEGKEQEIK